MSCETSDLDTNERRRVLIIDIGSVLNKCREIARQHNWFERDARWLCKTIDNIPGMIDLLTDLDVDADDAETWFFEAPSTVVFQFNEDTNVSDQEIDLTKLSLPALKEMYNILKGKC